MRVPRVERPRVRAHDEPRTKRAEARAGEADDFAPRDEVHGSASRLYPLISRLQVVGYDAPC